MPTYVYKCTLCERLKTEYRQIRNRNRAQTCPMFDCGGILERCKAAETVNSTEMDYLHPVYSEAMGVDPSQVREHRQRFPDIPMTNEGQVVCKSHAERKRIMKKLQFHDKDGY